jgi:hypothetical protein
LLDKLGTSTCFRARIRPGLMNAFATAHTSGELRVAVSTTDSLRCQSALFFMLSPFIDQPMSLVREVESSAAYLLDRLRVAAQSISAV